ncbi:MAG: hypothetical protein L0215_00905 [Gemmataceae bacterium]|nr:hypothetical protein [Gemmataceae bacterium]
MTSNSSVPEPLPPNPSNIHVGPSTPVASQTAQGLNVPPSPPTGVSSPTANLATSCLVLGLLLAIANRFPFAAAQDDAKSIVDRAVKAHGGAENLAKFKAQSWKAKGTMTVAGMKMVYNADYLFVSPNKFRFDLEMEAGGKKMTISAATDGKNAWEQAPPLVRDMAKDKQAEFHHNVYVMHLLQIAPLKDKAFTLTPLGESKLGDRTLVGVKVSHAGQRDVALHFDKKTSRSPFASLREIPSSCRCSTGSGPSADRCARPPRQGWR